MTCSVALLRGINVGGNNKVPMAELRELCVGLGWGDVRTYIQSGNVVFRAPGTAAGQESALERGIQARFGLAISVIVRPGAAWAGYMSGNPFVEACERTPNLMMLCLSKGTPREGVGGAVGALRGRARDGELVERAGDAVWIYFAGGSGRSRLSPTVVDRAVGSPVTMRNWRTVVKLGEMVGGEG